MQGRHEEALPLLERALTLDPSLVPTRVALGNALFALHRHASAVRVLKAGLALHPRDRKMQNAFIHNLHAIGRGEEAWPLLKQLAAEHPADQGIADGLCSMSNYAPGLSADEIAAVHRRFG